MESYLCVPVAHIQVLKVYIEVVMLRKTVLRGSPTHLVVVVPKVRLNVLAVGIDV